MRPITNLAHQIGALGRSCKSQCLDTATIERTRVSGDRVQGVRDYCGPAAVTGPKSPPLSPLSVPPNRQGPGGLPWPQVSEATGNCEARRHAQSAKGIVKRATYAVTGIPKSSMVMIKLSQAPRCFVGNISLVCVIPTTVIAESLCP